MTNIYGTSGKDNPLKGTAGNDSIYGLAGDDRILTNDMLVKFALRYQFNIASN